LLFCVLVGVLVVVAAFCAAVSVCARVCVKAAQNPLLPTLNATPKPTTTHYTTPHTSQADKLLSPEFQPLIEQLIGFLPEDRQVMLFSATFPVTVKQFKERFLRKPYIINLMVRRCCSLACV
jgi:hypothetical protein